MFRLKKKRTRGGVDIPKFKLFTLAVLHFEISALNAAAQENANPIKKVKGRKRSGVREQGFDGPKIKQKNTGGLDLLFDKLVTLDTSQSPITP